MKNFLKTSLAISSVFSFGWLLVGHANHALADTPIPISNVAPQQGSADVYVDPDGNNATTTPVSTQGWPSLEIGQAGSYSANYLWLKVYVPIGAAATVTVQNGAGDCTTPVNDSVDVSLVIPHAIYTLEDLSDHEAELGGLGTYFQTLDSLANGNGCGNLSFPTIAADQGTQSQIIGHGNYRVFLLKAHIVNCVGGGSGCPDAYKVFRVFAEAGNNTSFSSSTDGPLVGYSRTTDAFESPFGISYPNIKNTYGNDTDFTYAFQFGTYCTDVNASTPITTYSMENGAYNPQFLSADLDQEDKTATVPSWTQLGPAPPAHTYTGADIGATSPDQVFFNAEPLYRYEIYINRVNWNNVYQLYIPYDQFDASDQAADCFDSTCSVSASPTGDQPTGSNFNVTVVMTNTGLSSWDPNAPNKYVLLQTNTKTGVVNSYTWGGSPPPVINKGDPPANFVIPPITDSAQENVTYTYQMQNQLGEAFGATCPITLTWSNATTFLYPYFKVYGGDISAGGAFRSADGSCDYNDYVAPSSSNGNNQYYGGIRAYADPVAGAGGAPKGSSVDFGAYALGLITGNSTDAVAGASPYGFYSDAANPGTDATPTYNDFNFANQDVLGGLVGDLSPTSDSHCAPDYYDETVDTSSVVPSAANPFVIDATQSGQQKITPVAGTPLEISGVVSNRLTLYVTGNVYINGNITSSGWGFYTDSTQSNYSANDAPYFALIVKGNIYVAPTVTTLDGLYVAQPSTPATKDAPNPSDGIFSTCAEAADPTAALTGDQITNDCNKQLVINGAVVAQHVHLLRSYGGNFDSLNSSEPGPYDPTNPTDQNYQAAEIFNFTPSIVLGQPYFNSQQPSAGNLGSLPPVF